MLCKEPSLEKQMKDFLRKTYGWLVLAPLLMIVLGIASNQAVLIANHGKFPVMLNERQVMKLEQAQQKHDAEAKMPKDDPDTSKFSIANTGKTTRLWNGQFMDDVHSVMGPNSRLKFMADIFDLGNIYSVGDGFIIISQFFFPYLVLICLGLNALNYASLQKVAYCAFGLVALKGTLVIVDDATLGTVQNLLTAFAFAYATYMVGKALATARVAQK
jgi:hypothetical protein